MGVCSHSSSVGNEEYVIFSIDNPYGKVVVGKDLSPEQVRSMYSIEDADRMIQTEARMFEQWLGHQDIPYKRLLGSYKGEQEPAFIVNQQYMSRVVSAGWVNNQESILLLSKIQGRHRYATLYYLTAKNKESLLYELGRFYETTEEFAKKHEAWTYDPSTGLYFITDVKQLLEPDTDIVA